MAELTSSANVRLVVLDEDATVRAALTALKHAFPLAVAYASLDHDGLESLKQAQPQVVVVDGHRVRDHLAPLVDVLAHLPDLDQLILISEDVEPAALVPGIQVVSRTGDAELMERTLKAALQPILERSEWPALSGHLKSARHEHLVWLGSLSAMLAHEINGPVDGARRFLKLARQQLQNGGSVSEHLEEIDRALNHVARLGKSLLAFERSSSTPRPPRAIAELVAEVVQYVRSFVGEPWTEIQVRLADPQELVPAPLFQVLANLLSNSMQAMAGRGVVCVSCQRVAGERVAIAVADDGPGIPAARRETLFKPFSSTKPYGHGSGLGLPICQQIVHSLGGTFTIDSVVGAGTTITVTVPAPPRDQPT